MSYPKTSCPCQECNSNNSYHKELNSAQPCSLGIPSCKKSLNLEYCTNNQIYKQDIQPKKYKEFYSKPLNKIGPILDKKWYIPVKSNLSNNCQTSFAGFNPILVDPMRAQRLLLDQPHYTGEIPVGNVCNDQIYTPYFSKYGKRYSNYNDITGGQIQYYLTESSGEIYSEPVFSTPALVDHTIFVDPMGNVRPEYNRQSLKSYGWDPCMPDSCDSFTHNQLEFRQELMEKQLRKRNSQEYDYRWAKALIN